MYGFEYGLAYGFVSPPEIAPGAAGGGAIAFMPAAAAFPKPWALACALNPTDASPAMAAAKTTCFTFGAIVIAPKPGAPQPTGAAVNSPSTGARAQVHVFLAA